MHTNKMSKPITLPSISSLLNREDHPHSAYTNLKLPEMLERHDDEEDDYNRFNLKKDDKTQDDSLLPISPLSLSSSPYNAHSPLSPLSPLPKSTANFLPHIVEDSLTHTRSFPILPTHIETPHRISISKKPQPQSSQEKSISISFKPAPQIQIIQSSSTGGAILKRRRGRPPVFTEYHSQSDPTGDPRWTFLTPTVWDIKSAVPSRPKSAFSTITLDFNKKNPSMGIMVKENGKGNSCFPYKVVPESRPKKKKSTPISRANK